MTEATTPHLDLPALDALTGGAFTAQTSGERATRIREWLAQEPRPEHLQAVFKELSGRDKGAAKPVRERLDELKRARAQETAAAEWAQKAQALLDLPRLNLADALAWQRDAAKAGAPLAREPLAALKARLNERVKGIEDLQNRVQVQREAAVLLAQRIEVLSTKPWREAQAATELLQADIVHWQAQAGELAADPNWASVEARFPPLLEASKTQLQVVRDAFSGALAQAVAAAADAQQPLPPVPVWADELRAARGLPMEAGAGKSTQAAVVVPPEVRAQANDAVQAALKALEQEVALGHGKASAGAAAALRNALKEHGRLVDDALDKSAQAALATAGELEGWQRWRADQLRQELVRKAEALLLAPPPPPTPARLKAQRGEPAAPTGVDAAAPAAATEPDSAVVAPHEDERADGAAPPAADAAEPFAAEPFAAEATPAVEPAPAGAAAPDAGHATEATAEATEATAEAAEAAAPRQPRLGGRKLQETLRSLREQWKEVDKGGPPNHALWRRFDAACSEAHRFVEEWQGKVRAQAAEHRAQRLALIDELNAWAADNPTAKGDDWKGFARILREFGERWRASGHLSEKAFAELQPQWKAALQQAAAPLEALQQQSLERRHAMIDEAAALGADPVLRLDAVKSLQQRWQAEAQRVPVDRRHEQKLWDAFRKPIDEAFQRKTAERAQAAAAMSERDRAVLDASNALEAANASGDAQAIRAAMTALDAALRGQAEARNEKNESNPAPAQVDQATPAIEKIVKDELSSGADPQGAPAAAESIAPASAADAADADPAAAPEPASEPPKPAPKPVVAVRGDDRPGMKKAAPAGPPGRAGGGAMARPGGRRDDPRGGPSGAARPGGGRDAPFGRGDDRPARFGAAPQREERGPRLGDTAFRAQREALEHAQQTLRKLAAQAHGEALTELLGAWERRDAQRLPNAQTLGARVAPALRANWVAALQAAPGGAAAAAVGTALLRLEIAAEVPTPAEHVSERRLLQLQLLTRRNDPGPTETWGADVATLLASAYDTGAARRLQNALKALLRG